MRKFLGILFMLLGISLVVGAMLLLLNNRQEDQQAQEFSHSVIPILQEEIRKVQQTAPPETVPRMTENIPEEYLIPKI